MDQLLDRQRAPAVFERQLLEELPIFGARLSPAGEILECNFPTLGGPKTSFRRTPEFLIGRSIASLHYWSHDPSSVERIQRWLKTGAGGKSVVEDLPYRRLSGERGKLEFSLRPIFTDGSSVHCLICTCQDNTELRRSQAQLKATEQRFEEMAHGLPLMVWMDDTYRVQVFVNKTYCDFFDILEEEAPLHSWQNNVHPDDRKYCVLYDDAVAQKKPFRHQLRLAHASGQWRNVEMHAKPNYTQAGEYVGFIGTSIDVTERLIVESRLAEADKRKDEFLATLGHELRNPLAPILTSIEFIKESGKHSEQVNSAIDIIERQSRQMALLIDDLMDASRVSQGRYELRPSVECVDKLIENAIETAQPLIDNAGHTVVTHFPAIPSWANIDALRISQAITNLLNNAAKFTPAGGRIEVRMAVSNDGFDISVSDSGRGFAAENIDSVFDMYTQLDKQPVNGEIGLGVGLALSRDLVERHGGTLTVKSDGIDQGSTFSVWLPPDVRVTELVVNEESALDSWSDPRSGVSDEPAEDLPKRPRVLVVDDNKDAGFILSKLLEHLGVATDLVHDGLSAIETAQALEPDMILLDINLPDINGYEVAKKIRAMPWAENARLIAISGLSHNDDVSKSMQSGFDLHKVKPVSLKHLRPLVEELYQ